VRLYTTQTRRLLALAASLALTLLFAFLLIVGETAQSGLKEAIMSWGGLVLFGGLTLRAVVLLLAPSAARLTLDADGFTISSIFWHVPTPWRNASGFRTEQSEGELYPHVVYEVRPADMPPHPGTPRETRTLPDNYGLPADDFAWLMNQWRARTLTFDPTREHASP
jgi:hypothetical protein